MSFLFSLLTFWLLVHLSQRALAQRRQRHNASPPLPAPISRPPRRKLWLAHADVTVKPLHVHVSTSALNDAHGALAAALDAPARRARHARNVLTRFYDLGSVFGALGLGLALGVLAWTAFELVWILLPMALPSSQNQVNYVAPKTITRLARRAFTDEPVAVASEAAPNLLLQPIIPGVTVPLSHLPLLLAALFACQLIHEAGHFLAAALSSTALHSAGVALTVVLPSAFVSLSASALRAAPPATRLRIVAAGAWHNLVFYGLLALAGWSRLGPALLHMIGYEDVTGVGRVVLSIEEDSGLGAYIPLGALLTKLDDTSLGRPHISPPTGADPDTWTAYLTSPDAPRLAEGWCVGAAWFATHTQACCPPTLTPSLPPSIPLACFTPAPSSPNAPSDTSAGRCLDPVPLLTTPAAAGLPTARRCRSSAECRGTQTRDGGDEVCIQPDASAALLRLAFRASADGAETTVLWHGPRLEVWEQVEVGTVRPLHAWLPLGLPWLASTTFEYLKLITLSLYLFNLLPLPFLDGAPLLAALLALSPPCPLGRGAREQADAAWLDDAEGGRMRPALTMTTGRGWRRVSWRGRLDDEDEDTAWRWPGATGRGREGKWRGRGERAVVGGTCALVLLDVALGLLVFLRRL